MSDYICPNCRGGFPEAIFGSSCPWCGQSLDASYESPEPPVAVSKTVEKDENEKETLFSLFR